MRNKVWWAVGLVVALGLVLLSPLASAWPDGLERVAEDRGFIDLAQDPLYELIPDYVLPGVGHEHLATILAGLIGVLVLFGVGFGVGYLLRVRRSTDQTRQV
jgi:hypothetical protein